MASLLMQPGRISGLDLKNRIMLAPMGTTLHNLNEGYVAYFVERAKGGAGIITCNIMVTDSFEAADNSILLDEVGLPHFTELCRRCHEHGAKVCAQLMPGCGRIGGPSKRYEVPISASACGWLYAPQVACHELTVEEIGELLEAFRQSARRAIEAGADLIEIHAYGGYLNDQFLTRAWNKRSDGYGGDLAGRCRFLREQMEIVREVGGEDYPLLVKYCPDHYVPEDEEHRGIEEGIALSKLLVEYGAKALHVDAGCYERWYLAMPPSDLQEMNLQSRSAKIIRRQVEVPVITHGRFSNVAKAESALRNEICDFVAIGRGLLADPFLPQKVAEGRTEDIRPCISCNEGCIYSCMKQVPVTCAVNPRVNREDGSGDIPPAKTPKRLLVVGGGPGGCTAALLAKEAGHEVELWEQGPELGGNALAAAKPYFKRDMHALINYYRTQLLKAGVPVRCFAKADYDSVAYFAPDAVIWAAGGRSLRPASIPGLDGPNVYTAGEALSDLVPVGRRVLVMGGGMVGVETALHFARSGREVTTVEMADKMLPQPMFPMNETLLREMMAASGAVWLSGTRLLGLESDALEIRARVADAQGERVLACDTVLMALGFSPSTGEAEELKALCPVHPIGDSVTLGRILNAVHDAWEVVRRLSEE